jgi:hypothetical protein
LSLSLGPSDPSSRTDISARQDWPHFSAMSSKDVGIIGKAPESDLGDEAVEPLTKAQRKQLVLKTDLVIMPLAIVCMTIAFLDKVSHPYNTPIFALLKDHCRMLWATLPFSASRKMHTSRTKSTAGSAASSTSDTLPWSSQRCG